MAASEAGVVDGVKLGARGVWDAWGIMDELLSGTEVATGASDVLPFGSGVLDDLEALGISGMLLSGAEVLDDSWTTGVSDVVLSRTRVLDETGTSGVLLTTTMEEVLER